MRYLKPHYYERFRCAADQCPDTCCAGWQIMIDEDAMERYMRMEGAFGSRLANGIDWREGCFLQYYGRCSMLNDSNLCDLVVEQGKESLCETCARYPRHVEEYEGVREWSLSLSCPVAAEIIVSEREPVRFLIEENEEEDPLEDEFEDFDLFLFTKLEDARNVLFGIAQDRDMQTEQRGRLILNMAEKMQRCLDEDRLCDIDGIISQFGGQCQETGESKENSMMAADKTGQYWNEPEEEERFLLLKRHFEVFRQLEVLRDDWSVVMDETAETLFADYEVYQVIRREFLAEYGVGGRHFESWEIFRENVLMFFLYTYFCGAVYDDRIYSKAALCVFSMLFIEEFVMCRWYLSDKYISRSECVRMAYRYAREVEHSDNNLDLLEEWLQRNPLKLKGTEQ